MNTILKDSDYFHEKLSLISTFIRYYGVKIDITFNMEIIQ